MLVLFGEEHLEGFEAMASDPETVRFTRLPSPLPDDFAREWLGRYERARGEGTRELFAILDDTGEFAGFAGAVSIDREAAEAELGYVLTPAARGRGLATAALIDLTRWAFSEGLLRLTLHIDAANASSRRVAERAGYVLDGVMRNAYVTPGVRADTEIWSKLPSD